MKKNKKQKKPGFTLIELLVVVLIVGILAGVALPQYSVAVEKARATEAMALMNAVAESSERYCFQKDSWPTQLDELDMEVPFSSTTWGGKNFSIEITTGAGASCTVSQLVISAVRKIQERDRYTLTTSLTPGANETITSSRSCAPTGGSDKAQTYCNAITNGRTYF